MPVTNSDGTPVRDLFGVAMPDTTGAPGSPGATGDAADNVAAGPTSLPMLGTWQSTSRYDADTSGTLQAGQTDPNVIAPAPAGSFASTGAGRGQPSHFPRRPWQQPDGSA